MIKKVDLAKKLESKKKVFSTIFREIQGQGWPSFYLSRSEGKLVTVLVCSNLLEIKGFHVMKKIYLKGSISRRSFVKKLAKQCCSSSAMAVTVERRLRPKRSPRKVEIQNLSKFYLVYDFHSKYKHRIPKQVKNSTDTKTSRDGYKDSESYISLVQREFSESINLSWPFHKRISSTNQQVLTKSEVTGRKPLLRLATNLLNRSTVDTYNAIIEPEVEDLLEKVEVGSSLVSFDVIVSPKSRPGWPLLMISVPPTSNDSSNESENTKDETPENQLELDLLPSIAISSGCKRYEYEHLNSATSHFSSENLIGEGGYSSVYKGCIPSGQTVAVKVLKPYKEALADFSLEVNIMSSIKHKNIVPLLGICLENGLLISVHDYFPKGSLEDYLHVESGGSVLPWEVRFNVAIAIAEALDYLHNDCSQPIIHRDVKSSNIFLTNEFQPQLSDFGLAIWGSADSAYSVHSDIAGTFGYIAPEYFMYGRISDKTDVYAFGVVLLELLTGRRPISTKVPKGEESLVTWAQHVLERGDYEALLDPKLKGDFDTAQMHRMALAARLCISQSPRVRPRVSQILDLLKDCRHAAEFFNSRILNSEFGYQDDDDESVFEFGLRYRPSFNILDADDDNIAPSCNDSNTTSTSSEERRTRRFKLKDFLSESLDL